MMKTILVPIDFSECSKSATKAAVRIAMATKARVVFLHNIVTDLNWETLKPAQQMQHEETFLKNKKGKRRLYALPGTQLLKNVRTSLVMTYGITDEQIVTKANQLNADFIVMGSHQNEGPDKLFIGSVIQKVLREASCPVLMVKKDSNPSKWKRVAVALDLDHGNRTAFEKVRKMIADLHAKVFLVFVNRPNDFMDTRTIHQLMDTFTRQYPDMKFDKVIYNHKDVAEGIMDFAEDNKIDWVSLLTRNRRTKPKYLIGTTETIAYRSVKPVLSVNILPEVGSVE